MTAQGTTTAVSPLLLNAKVGWLRSAPEVDGDDAFFGPGTLEVTQESISFRHRNEKSRSKRPFSVKWTQVSQLKNEILTKRKFSASFEGIDEKRYVFLIRIKDGDLAGLSNIVDGLPESVTIERCPSCHGCLRDGKCEECGLTPKEANRGIGVVLVVAGGALLLLGILLTLLFKYILTAGMANHYPVLIGLIGIGGGALIVGILQILTGKNINV